MAFDLIIFDCDGTLVDSEILVGKALYQLLAEQGVTFTLDDYAPLIGRASKDNAAELARRFQGKLPPNFLELREQRNMAAIAAELQPMNGIHDLLKQLHLPVCVASSSKHEHIRLALQKCGLWDFFAPNLFSATQVAHGKPAPDLFLFAAEQMKADPSRCLVIEDSVHGVTGGKAAGMTVFGYTGCSLHRPNHRETLLAAGADAVFASMAEISARLTTQEAA